MAIRRLTCAVAPTLLFVATVLVTAAHADDEYGTGHESVIRNAAMGGILGATAQNTPELRFVPGRNDTFGALQNDALIRRSAMEGSTRRSVDVDQAKIAKGYYAADGSFRLAPLAGSRGDLVGAGRRHALAREIYRPGSTDF